MKKIILFFIFIICLIGNIQSQTFPNPATLSTGQGALGSNDPLWIVTPWYTSVPPNPMGLTYIPALISNNCAPGAWVNPAALPPPINNGNWISGSDAPCTGISGYRYFRLTLNLPADCDGNSVTVAGNYILYFSGYVDNGISDVFINGNSTGISGGGFSNGSQLNMTLVGPWVAGINYVDVLVYNGGGPYGLLLVANTTAYAAADGDHDGVLDINDICPCVPGSLASGCPASIIGDTIVCKGQSTTLTATGTGTYLWSTGSTNSSITVAPATPTNYYVLVTTSSGFKDSSAIHVSVNLLPTISITGDTMFCNGEATTLTATGGGTYLWSTGSINNSINVSPSSTSNYKVVVTNTNSCKDSVTQRVTVFPKPVADFTFVNKCNGTGVPFTSTSTINVPGIITSWNWDFGDGATGTGSTASHIYGAVGNYNVKLIVNSSTSCADTVTHQITVFNNPVVDFTHTDVCFGDSLHFGNTSSVNLPDSISSYIWNFGDGSNPSSLHTAVHDYANAGAYNVTLIVTSTNGCSNAITHPVNVFDAPQAAFTFNNICLLTAGVFTNTSINPTMGAISNWSWDFGDGSPLNTSVDSPNHIYSTSGNYQVTLISHSTNLGCADTATHSITVSPMPVAKFGTNNVCLNQAMNLHDSSSVSSGAVTSWSWDFGDASVLNTLQNPNHTYSNYGTYAVSFISTTNNGCSDSITKSVVVHPLPLAQFSTANVCNGISTSFSDQSHIPITDTMQLWKWNFGDGSSINTNENSSHLYATAGSYTVQLWIASKFGCVDSITKTSVVNPNPTVNFKGDDTTGCEPLCVNFQNLSFVTGGTSAAWLWSFGDGSPTITSQNSQHCYQNSSVFAPMLFNVVLTVTSDSGCATTVSKNNYITVYAKPNIDFTVSPSSTTIINPIISITDLTTGANFWNWNFGDGDTTLVSTTTSHTYADTGTYVMRLITSTIYNCIDTTYQTITIEPEFVFYIPTAFSPNDDGVNDTFSGKGILMKEYQMAIFDRWGNLVYQTDDMNKPWDGKVNHGNDLAKQDVYVYTIKVTDIKNKKHNYKGIVSLVK
jgi:gliding motility-associated-like protein